MPDSPGPVEVRTWKLVGKGQRDRDGRTQEYVDVKGPWVRVGDSVTVVDRDAFVEDVLAELREKAHEQGLTDPRWPGQAAVEWCADYLEARLGRG